MDYQGKLFNSGSEVWEGVKELYNKDLRDFSRAQLLVFALMKDGEFHSATSIIEASGLRSGLRVMRSLRSEGYVIDKQRVGKSREWYYRLAINSAS